MDAALVDTGRSTTAPTQVGTHSHFVPNSCNGSSKHMLSRPIFQLFLIAWNCPSIFRPKPWKWVGICISGEKERSSSQSTGQKPRTPKTDLATKPEHFCATLIIWFPAVYKMDSGNVQTWEYPSFETSTARTVTIVQKAFCSFIFLPSYC